MLSWTEGRDWPVINIKLQAAERRRCCLAAVSAMTVPEVIGNEAFNKKLFNLNLYGLQLWPSGHTRPQFIFQTYSISWPACFSQHILPEILCDCTLGSVLSAFLLTIWACFWDTLRFFLVKKGPFTLPPIFGLLHWILTCHSRKSTVVTNTNNVLCTLFSLKPQSG